MKNVLKKVLVLALALTLVAGLAMSAHAAEPDTASGFALQVTDIWCTEGCDLHQAGPNAVKSNKIIMIGRNDTPGQVTIRYYWDDYDHSDDCTVDAQLDERNWVQYTINDFDCTKDVNLTTVVSPSNAPAHRIAITRARSNHNVTYRQYGDNQHTGTCSGCSRTITEDCTYSIATCVAPATCTGCGRTKGEADSTNHDWNEGWKSSANGTHYRTCKRDSSHRETANCTGEGATCNAPAACTVCNQPVGEKDPNAHVWTNASPNGDGTHTRICKWNRNHTEISNCSGGTATCTSAAVCSACNTVYGEPLGHRLKLVSNTRQGMTVGCENCDYSCKVSVGIEPGDLDDVLFSYTGDPITPIKITYSTEWIGKAPVITYENNVQSNSNATATAKAYFEDVDCELANSFFILAADIDSAAVTVSPASGTYTGEAHTPAVTVTFNGKTLAEGTDYTTEWDSDLTVTGTHTVTVKGEGNFSGSKTADYAINAAGLTDVSVTQNGKLSYTGSEQTPSVTAKATTVDNSEVFFTYSLSKNGPYSEELPKVTEIGTYTVYYYAEAEHHARHSGSFTVTVGKAANEWTTTPAIEGWTYGKTAKTPVAEAKYGDYTVTYTGTTNAGVAYESATAPTEAGTYKAIFTVAESDDYGALTAEVDFIIDRAVVTPADITYTKPDLTYNGQNRSESILGSLVAPVAIRVNFTNVDTGVDEFPVNAGNYSFKVRVAEATDNYYFTGGEYMEDDAWVFTIKKVNPAITWVETEFTYDGAEHGDAIVTLVNDETYTGAITYTSKAGSTTADGLPVNAGTYTVTASIAEQANYEAATETTTIVIKPKAVTPTVTLSGDAFPYNGAAHHPALKVEADGNVLPEDGNYTVSYANATEVGVATVTVTAKDGSNYTFDPVSVDYLILPDVCPESGVTPENVTSEYLDLINEIQEQMDGVDTSTVSQAAQDEWKEIEEYLASLEAAIREILAAMQQFIDETAALPDHPTGDDLDKIDELLDLYDDIKDRLTDEEKEDLADEVTKLETEKEHIRETAEKVDEFVEDMDDLMDKDLTYKDKETVVDLSDRVNELQNDPHLTQEDKSLLTDADQALDIILSAYRKAEEVEKLIDKLPKTAEPDDEDVRDAYKEAKKAYDDLDEGVKKLVNPKYLTKLEKLAKALRNYKITKGDNQWWYTNDEEPGNLTLTANGPYSKFDYIKIDGQIIDEKHYTSKEGSTIVTLKESFLETLSYARHTISIGFTDGELSGEATGHFRVTLHLDSPATGDTTNLVLFGVLGLSSLLALAALTIVRKKRGA